MQEIATQLQRTPTREEYFKLTKIKISRKTILKYFDSYTNAIKEANLDKKQIHTNCNTCGLALIRTESTISIHNFCNHSCSAKYTNTARKEAKTCQYCNSILIKSDKYCNIKCQKQYEYQEQIKEWKNGTRKGYTGITKAISNPVRKYMLIKANYSCQQCGWNKLHPIDNRPLVEIDHIDGNAENCSEENLRVLCPNCHSMTHTFRARNKISARQR